MKIKLGALVRTKDNTQVYQPDGEPYGDSLQWRGVLVGMPKVEVLEPGNVPFYTQKRVYMLEAYDGVKGYVTDINALVEFTEDFEEWMWSNYGSQMERLVAISEPLKRRGKKRENHGKAKKVFAVAKAAQKLSQGKQKVLDHYAGMVDELNGKLPPRNTGALPLGYVTIPEHHLTSIAFHYKALVDAHDHNVAMLQLVRDMIDGKHVPQNVAHPTSHLTPTRSDEADADNELLDTAYLRKTKVDWIVFRETGLYSVEFAEVPAPKTAAQSGTVRIFRVRNAIKDKSTPITGHITNILINVEGRDAFEKECAKWVK